MHFWCLDHFLQLPSLISLENLKIIIIKNISEMHCQQIQLLHKLVWIGFVKLPTPPMLCVCAKRLHKQMEPMICGWTLILSIWSLGQYHRCIEQEATALLFSRQVLRGISELAPPVFSHLKCTRLFFHWMLKAATRFLYLYSWVCNHRRRLLDRPRL